MILEAKNLSFSYQKSRTIFNNVSFRIDAGEILTILGTNGAGKSTLLNCIANMYKPDSGEILLNGKRMSDMDISDVAKLIGYVPQLNSPAYGYSVLEYVVMGRTPYIGAFSTPGAEDYQIANESIEKMDIMHLRDKPYTQISGGEQQQVQIARSLAQQTKIILLDEPTAHLDYGNQFRVVEMIRNLAKEGYSMIMTTHNPEHAFILTGKVAILNRDGMLCVGCAEDTLDAGTLSELYALSIKTKYDADAKRKICIVC
ncbi:MAG: ABC transporter ATP-binding protein [Spirochaetales bacterium]|uniref:ABC transporter ATP-binding protein n=1 Tax=Candidatus Thalassospirochaeta sargassi TaxID=3119039 RepID=A0AAJ1IDC8_9SPIO|nr:ABC transporter ATP-binding protein [Spirochaetales bacterium]